MKYWMVGIADGQWLSFKADSWSVTEDGCLLLKDEQGNPVALVKHGQWVWIALRDILDAK